MQASQVAAAAQVIQFATTQASQVAALAAATVFPGEHIVQTAAPVQVKQSALTVVHSTQVLASPVAPIF